MVTENLKFNTQGCLQRDQSCWFVSHGAATSLDFSSLGVRTLVKSIQWLAKLSIQYPLVSKIYLHVPKLHGIVHQLNICLLVTNKPWMNACIRWFQQIKNPSSLALWQLRWSSLVDQPVKIIKGPGVFTNLLTNRRLANQPTEWAQKWKVLCLCFIVTFNEYERSSRFDFGDQAGDELSECCDDLNHVEFGTLSISASL